MDSPTLSHILKTLADNPQVVQALIAAAAVSSAPSQNVSPAPALNIPVVDPPSNIGTPVVHPPCASRPMPKKFSQDFFCHKAPAGKPIGMVEKCERFPDFRRKVILLQHPEASTLPVASELKYLSETGFVKVGIQFFKKWSEIQMKNKIYELFNDLLPRTIDIQFLSIIGNSLCPFPTENNSSLNGKLLAELTGKLLIVRPLQNLPSYNEDSDEDIFVPRSSGSSVKKPKLDFSVITTEEGPVQKPKMDFGALMTKNGTHFFVDDVTGKEYPLIDHSVSNAEPKKALQSLELLKDNIIRSGASVEFSRNNVLEKLFQYFDESDFNLMNHIKVTFTNERGRGSGLLKEMLSIAVDEINDNDLLEGTPFKKTFKSSIIAERNFLYRKFGQAVAFILIHGGPPPCFFSETFFNLLFADPDPMETPDLEEVLNDHVKLEISLVKDADDNPAAINNALVGSEIFTAARTHSQVTGPNFSSQREEAVRDAIRYYCIDRLVKPVSQFREGMSVVFNVLKNDKVGAKQLFCYSPKAKLNAIDVKNLFVTVISKEKEREIFNHWTNYLNCLESRSEECCLNRLLFFATGLNQVPPLGFPIRPKLKFREQLFPTSKICFNELYLPLLVESYEEFETVMDLALEDPKLDEV